MENPWTRMVEGWGGESRMTNIRKEEEIKWEERKRKMDREKREKKGKITVKRKMVHQQSNNKHHQENL